MATVNQETLTPYYTFMTTAAKMLRNSLGSAATDQDIQDQVQDVIDFEIKFSKARLKLFSTYIL